MSSNWLANVSENPGLQAWRINNKSQEISVVPSSSFGIFHSDDCYIVLDTKLDDHAKRLCLLIVWIGKATSQEEYCMEKANELEEKLSGVKSGAEQSDLESEVPVVRSREVQEHESHFFQSLFRFKGGIQYVEAVVLANQVNLRDEEHATKLYHLKGRRNVRVKQVEVDFKSLNSGDVFVLDANNVIFQWNGAKASRMEKAKALDLTVRLRDERMNRLNAKIVLLEDGHEDDAFWNALGGKGPIASADEGGDDAEFEKASTQQVKLYRVSQDGDGNFVKTLVDTQGKPLHRSMLETDASFIVDAETEIFVWTGRKSAPAVRERAMSIATTFLKEQGRPNWTPITKVTEGVENALFKGKFQGAFTEFMDNPDHLAKRTKSLNRTAGTLKQEAVNVDAMHNPQKYALAKEADVAGKLISAIHGDDNAGELSVWIIKKNAKHELPLEEYGIFYSNECYLVQHSAHMRGGGMRHIVYYWIGRTSSTEDQGTAALLATAQANSLGGGVTQVRVTQNKEPEHFLHHFEGLMNTRMGARDTWQAEQAGKPQLFHIRGTNAVDTRAAQMKPVAASLNSNDAFVLKASDEEAWVWMGKGANEFERVVAVKLAEFILGEQKYELMEEGSESEALWKALGGKTAYSSDERLQSGGDIKARLFQCSDSTSVFKVMEIHDFVQDDLDNDDVMILDGYSELFVWIGTGSTEREKAMGVQVAHDYLKAASDGRPDHVPVYTIMAREEPPQFTIYFLGWDDANAKSGCDHYIRSLAKMSEGGFLTLSDAASLEMAAVQKAKDEYHSNQSKASASAPGTSPASAPSAGPIYPYERLLTKPFPDDVNPQQLERHLSPEDFAKYIKMTPEAFASCPQWKQLRIKKEAKLF